MVKLLVFCLASVFLASSLVPVCGDYYHAEQDEEEEKYKYTLTETVADVTIVLEAVHTLGLQKSLTLLVILIILFPVFLAFKEWGVYLRLTRNQRYALRTVYATTRIRAHAC